MKAIELDSTELTFHNNLAAVYFEMKEYDKVNFIRLFSPLPPPKTQRNSYRRNFIGLSLKFQMTF